LVTIAADSTTYTAISRVDRVRRQSARAFRVDAFAPRAASRDAALRPRRAVAP